MNELYKITVSKEGGKWRAVILRIRDEHHLAVESDEQFELWDLIRQVVQKSEEQ